VGSWRTWLGKRALLVVPVVGLTYGLAWAVQGSAPFLSSSACPEPSPSAASPSPSGGAGDAAAGGDERLSLSFGFQPEPLQAGGPVSWSFSLTNVSDGAVGLTFQSGQDGDVVLSQGGQERYRWSAGRFFTQAVRTVELGPGETHHFALEDTLGVEPGAYDLVATVASDPSPAPVERTVTVGSGGGDGTPSPTDDPSVSPSASPEPGATPSPSAEPSASPTPEPTPTSAPLIPLLAPRRFDRDDRHRRRRRGGRWSVLIALALATVPLGGIQAQEDGSGGKNVVLVINTTDDRLAARANLAQGIAGGPVAVPENLASASASCTDCRTVAVAMQAVLVTGDPDVASPRNAAVAANAGCTRCETFAYAWQYVVSIGGPVRITAEGHQTIADLEARASALAASDLPFPELVVALDGVAVKLRAVVDTEVERVGRGDGISERALDIEDDGC
jgi:hypothetical protein